MTHRFHGCKGGGLLVAALAAALVLTGCAAPEEQTLRLDIRDGVLRAAGAECGGGGSFRPLHPTAAYEIVGPDGEVVAGGELPQGTAEKSFTPDFGELLEPTACRMEFTVSGVSELDGYAIRVDGHPDIRIIQSDDEIPTAVVP
ncbi:hypothetical protein [Agromyces aerolatus]|uniref:hypothetical protein n=1 Tax=Agromyces sp. LY-1074 TaxID=3074080 RepID=UPI002861A519|nr:MULTISPECIES: hypothetical protein [unclassified Agromyces]MDR5701553.1 hypothetical protein [Agromyces sp. LY-1074]MDR5707840.1 hypothetical protein [Agromyces sp. LY-1358]